VVAVSSSEPIREKIQFAIQGVMDNSNFAIAIAVGIFGVLTLFVQIYEEELKLDDSAKLVARITLSVAYWVLIAMGLVAHAHHRMYNAVIENYIRGDYPEYKEDLRRATKGSRIMSLAISRLWLNKTTERINKDYNFITASFLTISFWLYVGIAYTWLEPSIQEVVSFLTFK
jgi:Ca2+/H+ antiporter